MTIQDFPQNLLERLEEIKALRKELADYYFQTGKINEVTLGRLQNLIKKMSDEIFKDFPVILMSKEVFVIPAPAKVEEIRFLEREGYKLIIPSELEGKSIEEIVEFQKQNLPKYIPIAHLFAVDAEFLVYLQAHLQLQKSQEGQGKANRSFIQDKLQMEGSIDVPKYEFVEQEEKQEFVSENISKKKKRKASEV